MHFKLSGGGTFFFMETKENFYLPNQDFDTFIWGVKEANNHYKPVPYWLHIGYNISTYYSTTYLVRQICKIESNMLDDFAN